MRVTIEHKAIPVNSTSTQPNNHVCTAIAEGEEYLVEEFYQYVSKFRENKRYKVATREFKCVDCEEVEEVETPHSLAHCECGGEMVEINI